MAKSICYEDLIYMAEISSITYSYHREREEEMTKALDEFGYVRISDELEYVASRFAHSLTIRSEASINNSKKSTYFQVKFRSSTIRASKLQLN